MTTYLLDTNIASYIIRRHGPTSDRLRDVTPDVTALSVISRAELLYGLAKRPVGKRLIDGVHQLLGHIRSLPWDDDAADAYANLRANSERAGISLGTQDMLIAAHAYATSRILVTNDQAFRRFSMLTVEDWTIA